MQSEKKEEEGSTTEEPEHLVCPITRVMYQDPVFLVASGQTYEMSAIEKHLEESDVDPITRVFTEGTLPVLQTNWGMRKAVEFWLKEHPNRTPNGWNERTLLTPKILQKPDKNTIASMISDILKQFSPFVLSVFDIRKKMNELPSMKNVLLHEMEIRDAAMILVSMDKAIIIGDKVKLV